MAIMVVVVAAVVILKAYLVTVSCRFRDIFNAFQESSQFINAN